MLGTGKVEENMSFQRMYVVQVHSSINLNRNGVRIVKLIRLMSKVGVV